MRERDGFTTGLWTSCAVKSLRIGWPAGLQEAQTHLAPSSFKGTLVCGVFEDVFPAVGELEQVVAEVNALDLAALCSRDTHHGRGLTDRFCELEDEAKHEAAVDAEDIRRRARERGVPWFLTPRALNVAWTWMEIEPQEGGTRTPDETPWSRMPAAMADMHTPEGRERGAFVTLLSGTYRQHARLAGLVAAEGWEGVRQRVHDGVVLTPRGQLW